MLRREGRRIRCEYRKLKGERIWTALSLFAFFVLELGGIELGRRNFTMN